MDARCRPRDGDASSSSSAAEALPEIARLPSAAVDGASGVLLLDKPGGLSSAQALSRVKGLYASRRAGHVGTLDPLATGMLPICLGQATRVANLLLAADKAYRFTLQLGAATSTGDAEGEVLARAAVPPLADDQVRSVLAGFLGDIAQVPPMTSALKRGGVPLYRLARAGIEVPRAARRVCVARLELIDLGPGSLTCEVTCGKGLYVRVLGEDIARALGSLGHLAALRRLWVGDFAHRPMVTLDALAELDLAGRQARLLPIAEALPKLPRVELDEEHSARFRQGQRLPLGCPEPAAAVLVRAGGLCLGIGSCRQGVLHPQRVFVRPVP